MDKTETAVFGGGCFWCTEALFQSLKGVALVTPGYAGGEMVKPSYEQVCSGRTGHAEVIKIEFDPTVIPYAALLEIFFNSHDPTTSNRQGADVGSQYRSLVLYTNQKQKTVAQEAVESLKQSGRSIVTEVKPLETFYPAEKYHQNYYENNPNQPYCRIVISPKLQHLKEEYSDKLKAENLRP